MSSVAEAETPAWVPHLQRIINHALALDEETLEALAELDSKVIGFHFINTELTLYLRPNDNGLQIETTYLNRPDVLIKGTPLNFITMMASAKSKVSSMPADMELVGDIGLAQRFQHIMQDIDFDLEEPLSKWVGDTAAFQIGKFLKNTRRFAFNTGKTLAQDVSEYLRFENEMLPDDLMVKEFCQEVDTFREDVDRLTQRIQKLETKLNKNKAAD